MNTTTAPRVVSRAHWLAERQALLAQEKELTRAQDELARRRRQLPWVRVDKAYVFDTPQGPRALGELFDGRLQLLVQHFMSRRAGTRVARATVSWPTTMPACCRTWRSAM